jgi:signal transduction histidine kinase
VSAALAAAGWVVAAGLGALALATRRELSSRMERLARAAHELRRPLTAARIATHGLGSANGDRPARAAAIERELARSARLLDDLDAIRCAPGEVVLVEIARPVSVPELVTDLAMTWEPIAAAHGRQIVLEPWDELPVVRGVEARLAQALGNLVANALEHGAGTVRIGARSEAGRVRVEVADAGPGLPEPIETLARGARGGRGRRGRGLAIAAEIARKHGGRLDAPPRSASGARVVLDLPAATGTTAGDGSLRAQR